MKKANYTLQELLEENIQKPFHKLGTGVGQPSRSIDGLSKLEMQDLVDQRDMQESYNAPIDATGKVDYSVKTREPLPVINFPKYPEAEIRQSLDRYMQNRQEASNRHEPLQDEMQKRRDRDTQLLSALENRDISKFQATDLSPAMALVDSVTGSNLSRGYRAPTILKEDQQARNALEDQLRKRLGDKEQIGIKQAEFDAMTEQEKIAALRQMFKDKTGAAYNQMNANAAMRRAQNLGRGRGSSGSNRASFGDPKSLLDLNKKYNKTYKEKVLDGGFATDAASISQLDGVIDKLMSGENITGPLIGNFPLKQTQAFWNPEAADAREETGNILYRSLKPILGGQFTKEELKLVVNSTYNPELPEEVNAKRIKRLQGVMRSKHQMDKNTAAFYEKNGYSLAGYDGIDAIEQFANVNDLINYIQEGEGELSENGIEENVYRVVDENGDVYELESESDYKQALSEGAKPAE